MRPLPGSLVASVCDDVGRACAAPEQWRIPVESLQCHSALRADGLCDLSCEIASLGWRGVLHTGFVPFDLASESRRCADGMQAASGHRSFLAA